MLDIADPSVRDMMLSVTPMAVTVTYGGVTGSGHFAQRPVQAGADGPIVDQPTLVVADGHFPGIGNCEETGELDGINEDLLVGAYTWTIRDIVAGDSPGEIVLFLSNRRT